MPRAKAGETVDFFEHVRAYKPVVLDHLHHNPPHDVPSDYLGFGLSHEWAGIGDAIPAEVMTFTLGSDLAIVFLPGEIFVELGLAIK